MSALAIAFKKAGFVVTGSDVGFFPPVSTNLKKYNIDFYPGWHPENMGEPDLVIVGNVAGSTNPEWLYVQEKKLNYKSYPEAIEEFFLKANSIVCAGTYGKTSTSALLSFILTQADYNPSYMFGGITVNDFDSAKLILNPDTGVRDLSKPTNNELQKNDAQSNVTASKDSSVARLPQNEMWSVLEGDEYKSSRWDNGAKFFHYHPTHLLLTDMKWDHADVYPTEELYFQAFEKLIKSVPENGLIVASEHIAYNIKHKSKLITYGKNANNDYQYFDIIQNKEGIKFKIKYNANCYLLSAPMLGEYMAENIAGAFAAANQIGIEPEKIINAIAKFQGLKRRLEKRYVGEVTIFDDIAHSPAKAKSVLENLKEIYQSKIYCIFEPNGGNRQPESIPGYDNNFTDADEIIIPRLTHIKQDPTKPPHLEGNDLVKIISKTHSNVKYIDDDEKLINYLIENTNTGDVIVFCGSHGFRGMIDQLIISYENS